MLDIKAKANLIITPVIMTVAGQKNHYSVKLLKGYGVSINLKDNRLCLKGGITRSQISKNPRNGLSPRYRMSEL